MTKALLSYPLWAGDFSGNIDLKECYATGVLFARNGSWSQAATIDSKRNRLTSFYKTRGCIKYNSGTEISYYASGSTIIFEQKNGISHSELNLSKLYTFCRCGRILFSIPPITPLQISIPFFRTNSTRAHIPVFGVSFPLFFAGAIPSFENNASTQKLFFEGDVSKLSEIICSDNQSEIFVAMCLWLWLQNQAADLETTRS